MFKRYKNWKRSRKIKKVKPGDGHALKEFKWWQIFTRSLFFIRLKEEDGTSSVYAVNVHYFDEDEVVDLYRDEIHIARAKLPGIFPVPGGVIEVEATMYGLKRMHYVTEKEEQMLSPYAKSLEGFRFKLDIRYPRISKMIGYSAIFILLVSIVLGLPQLIALISQIPFIAERFGTFESPIVLSSWLNSTLATAAVLAALERALTLRYHWLIDLDTSWWEG